MDCRYNRYDKFNIVVAIWLADGRIFAENTSLALKIVELGKSSAIQSHGGGGLWKTLPEGRGELGQPLQAESLEA